MSAKIVCVLLKIGDQITLIIKDIAFGGEGVGRIDDFVVFVPFVVLGETVEVEITEVRKQFARARLLRVEKPDVYKRQSLASADS